MTLRIFTLGVLMDLLLGVMSYLFITYNSVFDSDRLQEIIERQEITVGNEELLEDEIVRLIDEGLVFSILSPNIYVASMLIMMSVFSFFFGIHVLIEKLFFRKFFEKPSYFDAGRRGFILVIFIAIIFYLKLLAVEIEILVLVALFGLLLEIGFDRYVKKDFLTKFDQFCQSISKKDSSLIQEKEVTPQLAARESESEQFE